MEGLSPHQLDTSSIHSHPSHLVDRLSGVGDLKAPNQVHLIKLNHLTLNNRIDLATVKNLFFEKGVG